MSTLELLALRSLLVIALVCGAGWWCYSKGEDHIQAKWDADKVERQSKENTELQADRDKAYTLAVDYESMHHDLEAKYAIKSADLNRALRAPVSCPASGSVGDVVVPADVVRGMFLRSAADPAGAAASQPDTVVR